VLPADLQVCFDKKVPAPERGTKSKAQLIQLIAALKRSDDAKSDCGRRLIAFYENLSR
jgi:hypothetical protein